MGTMNKNDSRRTGNIIDKIWTPAIVFGVCLYFFLLVFGLIKYESLGWSDFIILTYLYMGGLMVITYFCSGKKRFAVSLSNVTGFFTILNITVILLFICIDNILETSEGKCMVLWFSTTFLVPNVILFALSRKRLSPT